MQNEKRDRLVELVQDALFQHAHYVGKERRRALDGEYNPHDIVCEIHMSDGFNETDYCSYGERKCDNG